MEVLVGFADGLNRQDADIEISDDGMKITGKTEEGEYALTSGEETEIPEDSPSDVFIYRPSTAVMAMTVPEGHSITLATTDGRLIALSTPAGRRGFFWAEYAAGIGWV